MVALPYLIPGASSGAVRPRRCSSTSVKLEYGDVAWLVAERDTSARKVHDGSRPATEHVVAPLRRAAQAVVSIFF